MCVLIVECVYRCVYICFLCCRLNWQVGINRGDSWLHHYTLQLKVFNQYCWYLVIRYLRAMAVIWTLKEMMLVVKSVPCILIVLGVSFHPSLPCSNKQRVNVLSPPWGYFRPSPFTHWLCMLNIPSNHCTTFSVQGLLIYIINYYIFLESLSSYIVCQARLHASLIKASLGFWDLLPCSSPCDPEQWYSNYSLPGSGMVNNRTSEQILKTYRT